MEERNLICIGCPMGCPLTVLTENGQIISVTGNSCKRGESYARKEVTNPTRIVTSSVPVSGSKTGSKTVSVKTASDVPREKIFDVMRDLKGLTVAAPVHSGDVLIPDIAGTGVPIVATKDVF